MVVIFDDRTDFNRDNDRDLIVPSNRLQIHVAHPEGRAEEEVVTVLQREDVGAWFALGGSSALEEVTDALAKVLERRLYGSKKVTDPITFNILRCQGINAGRRYRRFRSGRYRATDIKPDIAASLLGRLGDAAMRAFDKSTANATKSLCNKHRKHAAEAAKKPSHRRK